MSPNEMINYRVILGLVLVGTLLLSCKRLFCKDEKLSLIKQSNTSGLLRLDGYYLNESDPLQRSDKNVFLLFGNGVFKDAHSGSEIEINNPKSLDYKRFWGLYTFNSSKIVIEKWEGRSCGGVSVIVYEGEILNDTTFTITHWKRLRKGKTKKEADVNAVFHFVHYAPKPDSVVTFL